MAESDQNLSFGKIIHRIFFSFIGGVIILGLLVPFFGEKILEEVKAWEYIKNLFDPLQLEIRLTSDDESILNRVFLVSPLYRDDCKVDMKMNAKNVFLLSCSKATKGNPIHFEILSGDMFCGKFDRQIGGSPEDIPINQCYLHP